MSKPTMQFQYGAIMASVWSKDNDHPSWQKSYSISVSKVYKDGDDWKRTSSFFVQDLPKVVLAVQDAYKALTVKKEGTSEDSSTDDYS